MPIRLATRAVIVQNDRLLLVNAYPGGQSDLWCAPGGGAEMGTSLPDNLRREVHEETGLHIAVGAPCLINEFHDPESAFHQVDIFFRCSVIGGTLDPSWHDPEQIVSQRRFFTRAELATLRIKPDSLIKLAFSDGIYYDPLELLEKPVLK